MFWHYAILLRSSIVRLPTWNCSSLCMYASCIALSSWAMVKYPGPILGNIATFSEGQWVVSCMWRPCLNACSFMALAWATFHSNHANSVDSEVLMSLKSWTPSTIRPTLLTEEKVVTRTCCNTINGSTPCTRPKPASWAWGPPQLPCSWADNSSTPHDANLECLLHKRHWSLSDPRASNYTMAIIVIL